MTIKILAKQLPPYGQQAISTALSALSVAGHLRRTRCLAGTGDQVRWVFRTFWSRTARDNEWWTTFLAAEDNRLTAEVTQPAPPTHPSTPAEAPTPPTPPIPAECPTAPPGPAVPAARRAAPAAPQQPQPDPGHPSPGYLALAQLGCAEPRLALSAADCETLEDLAREWLDRGVTPAYIVHVLTTGLPAEPINSPLGFVRRRLRDKKPPHQPTTPTPGTTSAPTPPSLMVECTKCGTPGRPEALPDGLCHTCRATPPGAQTPTSTDAQAETARDVHSRVEALRTLTRTP